MQTAHSPTPSLSLDLFSICEFRTAQCIISRMYTQPHLKTFARASVCVCVCMLSVVWLSERARTFTHSQHILNKHICAHTRTHVVERRPVSHTHTNTYIYLLRPDSEIKEWDWRGWLVHMYYHYQDLSGSRFDVQNTSLYCAFSCPQRPFRINKSPHTAENKTHTYELPRNTRVGGSSAA